MVQFYKLLTADLCHHGFTYKRGLNVDPLPFDPSGDCKPGGLYYTTLEYLPKWHSIEWPLIADVTLPDDARVYPEPCGTKWKADRLVLSNIRPLSTFLDTLDEATLGQMLAQNGLMLNDVDIQTDALCLAAVQAAGWALRHVQYQTEAICLAAVRQNGASLQFVTTQTETICLTAVQQNEYALQFVRNQTEAICCAAVAQNPEARCYVKIPIDF
jgi:hypothetical protein